MFHQISDLSDSPEDFLFMRIHLSKSANLGQVNVLPVAQSYDLIKCKYEIKTVLRDLAFLQYSAIFRDLKKYGNPSLIQDASKKRNNWEDKKSKLYHSGEKP